MTGALLLAVTAAMLAAVNPCGFAILPAYLSLLVSDQEQAASVRRALRCSVALTVGYIVVFGAFGLALAPIAGALTPRLPWLTVVLGLGLAAVGGWLLAGRSLPSLSLRAPVLTGSVLSMVLFGMAYALASLGCAIGPFLALVVTSLRVTFLHGVLLFLAYAIGMGLVITVTATAVALLRTSLLSRLRRGLGVVPRVGGAVLLFCGLYVAYYGRYELSVFTSPRHDRLVGAALAVQQWLADAFTRVGPGGFALLLGLLALPALARLRPWKRWIGSERSASASPRRPSDSVTARPPSSSGASAPS